MGCSHPEFLGTRIKSSNLGNNVDAAINPAPLVSRSSVRSASIVHPTTGFAANAETATSSAADQSTECEIFEMTQYDDLSTVVEKRKISRTAAIEWMKDDFDKASTGKLQNASAKIVFLQLSLADPTFLDFLDTLLSAAQIDKRLWEDLSVFSLGVRIVENRSIGSSHSRLSFYSPATTSSARVAWSFDTKCGTRAILLDDYDPGEYGNVNGSAQTFVKNQISLRHPLFLSISLRGILLAELQSRESSSSAILGHVEKNIGYDAFIPIESEADGLDLAEYSKQVGKDMNIMGMSKAILSLQISAREHLTSNDSYKLDKCFPGNETETYKKLCETVIRLDDNIEQQMRILRVELAATQERAKTLLTVVSKRSILQSKSATTNTFTRPAIQPDSKARRQRQHRARKRLSNDRTCDKERQLVNEDHSRHDHALFTCYFLRCAILHAHA